MRELGPVFRAKGKGVQMLASRAKLSQKQNSRRQKRKKRSAMWDG